MTETARLTLADFLLDRIAEDELVATNQAINWMNDPHIEHDDATDLEAWFNPVRIHADCVAKRRIIEHCTGWRRDEYEVGPVLELLALPYADHPSYREEWRA